MIQTLGDRIAVRPLQCRPMIGLLHMPDLKSHRTQSFVEALVVSHGAKVKGATTGKRILVSEIAEEAIVLDGEKLIVLRERDCVGVIHHD